MDLYAHIQRQVVAPLWAIWERDPYLRHYRTLLRTQYDTPEAIRDRQWQSLQALLRHAYATTDFWRRRFDSAGLTPNAIRSFEDLRRVPMLTKSDLLDHRDQMLSSEFRPERLHKKTTSGSTGIRVEVFVHDERQHFTRACTLRSDEWSGWRRGERIACIWGNPEFVKHGWRGRLRNRLLDRQRYLDTLRMDPATMDRFAEMLGRWRPSLLFGHAHSICILAEFLRSRGGATFRPRGIISTAMVLHQWEREIIEDVFRCPVTDRYGCEEVGQIACQCEQHHGMHIISECVYVETVRVDGTPAAIGEPGLVVVTDLVNRAMPILRYCVGDMAVRSDRVCACGRGLPLLERIEGRVADYVVTRQGELISGISLTENFAVLVPGVAQMQIVQETEDRFVFKLVPGNGFGPASLTRIRELAAERFGPGVSCDCQLVERIPPEPSGKYRFCISKVRKPFDVSAPSASTDLTS